MSVFDEFEPITEEVLRDMKFGSITPWYAWGTVWVDRCGMYTIQYNRDDFPGIVKRGEFKFVGRDLIFKLDDVFSKQDLKFAIDKCLTYVKDEHPHSEIYL